MYIEPSQTVSNDAGGMHVTVPVTLRALLAHKINMPAELRGVAGVDVEKTRRRQLGEGQIRDTGMRQATQPTRPSPTIVGVVRLARCCCGPPASLSSRHKPRPGRWIQPGVIDPPDVRHAVRGRGPSIASAEPDVDEPRRSRPALTHRRPGMR